MRVAMTTLLSLSQASHRPSRCTQMITNAMTSSFIVIFVLFSLQLRLYNSRVDYSVLYSPYKNRVTLFNEQT